MKMRRILILVFVVLFYFCGSAFAKSKQEIRPIEKRMKYAWASKPLDSVYWGIARGDLDGDGKKEWVFLSRKSIHIGAFDDKNFKRKTECAWKGDADGGRVYAHDVDGDGDDEIVITAVIFGKPSSLIMDYEGEKCAELISDIPYSLRVLTNRNILIGQSWSSSDFFTGSVFDTKISKGKLKSGKSLKLPWRTLLFDFDLFSNDDDEEYVLLQNGISRLDLKKRSGRHFKRVWRSPDKYGGSSNLLTAVSRMVLGSEKEEFVMFDVPPIHVGVGSWMRMLAIHQDMPLKGFVGRKPAIRGSEIVVFTQDEALGFVEEMRSDYLPGSAVDLIVDDLTEGGKVSFYVLTVQGGGFFSQGDTSLLLKFDIGR